MNLWVTIRHEIDFRVTVDDDGEVRVYHSPEGATEPFAWGQMRPDGMCEIVEIDAADAALEDYREELEDSIAEAVYACIMARTTITMTAADHIVKRWAKELAALFPETTHIYAVPNWRHRIEVTVDDAPQWLSVDAWSRDVCERIAWHATCLAT